MLAVYATAFSYGIFQYASRLGWPKLSEGVQCFVRSTYRVILVDAKICSFSDGDPTGYLLPVESDPNLNYSSIRPLYMCRLDHYNVQSVWYQRLYMYLVFTTCELLNEFIDLCRCAFEA